MVGFMRLPGSLETGFFRCDSEKILEIFFARRVKNFKTAFRVKNAYFMHQI